MQKSQYRNSEARGSHVQGDAGFTTKRSSAMFAQPTDMRNASTSSDAACGWITATSPGEYLMSTYKRVVSEEGRTWRTECVL